MKLDQYISELLFQYDCVIVPELGGFVGNYKPASIQAIQNTFNPPSKQISFNKNLNSNDGLLANHIAQREEITYSDACKKMTSFVAAIQQELNANKNVVIEDVGILFLDNENRIQFDPKFATNYLLASYGLTPFQKFPIKRDSLEDKITKEFKDRTAPLVVVKEQNSSTKKWLVAAITIPLTFFAIWIPSKYAVTGDINYANLNPFKPSPKSIYTERITAPEFKEVGELTIKEQIETASIDDYFINVVLDENEAPFVVQLKKEPIAEAVTTYVATVTKKLDFHVIGGCFSEKSNARKLVRKLKKAGFDASIIGQRKGLWTVSYNSFGSRSSAVEALADARDHNTKAWILNHSF